MRTLLCKDGREREFRINIPDDAIVTFGPSIAMSKNAVFESGREYALRVYKPPKNEANMIGVFTGVRTFREVNLITVETLIIKEGGKSVWNSDEHGFSIETKVNRNKKFVDETKLIEASNNDEQDEEQF